MAVLPGAAYLYGLRALPENTEPSEEAAAPAEASRLVWLQVRGSGEPMLPRLNPWTYHAAWGAPGATLAAQAARALLDRRDEQPSSWALSFAATTVWVSRNWSVDGEALERASRQREAERQGENGQAHGSPGRKFSSVTLRNAWCLVFGAGIGAGLVPGDL